MNVAGLPEILQSNDVPGDKTTNSGTIGSDFAKYGFDVIHVQEVGAHTISQERVNILILRLTGR